MRERQRRRGLLLLEDGSVFEGWAASPGTAFGEVVFNTSMTGYQEILTDPSYRGQLVVMTQPHMGNYGIHDEAQESFQPWVEGFLVRQFTREPSGLSPDGDLLSYLRHHRIPAMEGLDTRAVVRRLRSSGSLRGVLTTERDDRERLAEEVQSFPLMAGRALVDDVTCDRPWEVAPEGSARCRLAVYDFGAKANILRSLAGHGAHLHVLPARTGARECLDLGVDGIVLSNGPGDPEPLEGIIETVAELVASGRPVLGICLGHQLLGLALGGRTFKLKFGHHGGNQPVHHLATGQVLITSQNHGFALDGGSLPADCRVTEVNLNDGTVEAFEVSGRPVYSVQYHPEAAPGPHDASPLFGRFLAAVTGGV